MTANGATCDLCGRPAVLHVCTLGSSARQNYCEEHAASVGVASAPVAPPIAAIRASIEWLLQFVQQHDRLPNDEEIRSVGGAVTFSVDPVEPDSLPEMLDYFERILAFIDAHGRLPDEEDGFVDPF